jgi:hypothetical protein
MWTTAVRCHELTIWAAAWPWEKVWHSRLTVNLKKICLMVYVTPALAWVVFCPPLAAEVVIPLQFCFYLCECFVLLFILRLTNNLLYKWNWCHLFHLHACALEWHMLLFRGTNAVCLMNVLCVHTEKVGNCCIVTWVYWKVNALGLIGLMLEVLKILL